MKTIRRALTIFILLIIYIYICCIEAFPSNIIIYSGEKVQLKNIFGLTIENIDNLKIEETSQVSKNLSLNTQKINLEVNLFNLLKVKEINVETISRTKVIPVGKAIGMKLYTDGVLVVGMSEINGRKPYENSGILEGDTIIEINDEKIDDTEDLIEAVNECKGKIVEISYKRNEEIKTTRIEPVKTETDEYKLGLWVRDAVAGVGTMTFYEPISGKFAALGHGITDIDTSGLIQISEGELVSTKIISIEKGEKGVPGEIRGSIENGVTLGQIDKNTNYGIYGNITNQSMIDVSVANEMEVALRAETKIGKAQIMCQLDNNKVETYNIEIQKIYMNNYENNKRMVIKITDERLLEKTGGIIQGMSGAPIIQNGKFVGSVTHVLINNPTVGYGVFADIMLQQIEEVD